MTGKYYEDLAVGRIFDHPNGRTITETVLVFARACLKKMRPVAGS